MKIQLFYVKFRTLRLISDDLKYFIAALKPDNYDFSKLSRSLPFEIMKNSVYKIFTVWKFQHTGLLTNAASLNVGRCKP
jgi:hypothetical protein